MQTATTRPTKLGRPFTRRSLRKLVGYLRKVHDRVIRIGRKALRGLLARLGVTFQRTKTWKESPDLDREAKPDRIEEVLDHFPDRAFALDEFGPLGIRPTASPGWAGRKHPDRVPATHHRAHGVRFSHGCYSVGDDSPWDVNRRLCFTPTCTSWANLRQAAGERLAYLHFSHRSARSRRYDVAGNDVSGHGGRG
ncbi:COG3415 family protein [Streptomyces triticiradicis]|uniref:Transposase n=1 Tax=Streptomyces triticiradicis TaxID=2651189 RepID=A0A7J5DIA4_9ACTN|nr:hypothetical protein F8144_14015 [Streptomyces triticiradicis]